MPTAIVFLLAVVFALAAVSKLRSREAFQAVLRKLMPGGWDVSLSRLVPIGELLLAAFLLSGISTRWAAMTSILALAVFTWFLTRMRRFGLQGCACFGEESDSATAATGIARNLMLILGAAWIAARPDSVHLWNGDWPLLFGQATIVLGALCLWPCVVAMINRRQFLTAEMGS